MVLINLLRVAVSVFASSVATLPMPPASTAILTQTTAEPAYRTQTDIAYWEHAAPDEYAAERCRLDVYLPNNVKDFATIVYFHAGGLLDGERSIPNGLRRRGIGVAAVDYRLSPRATAPAYIEDAAAAVAWTRENIEGLGGNSDRIILAGHSAGGYLVAMLGLDKRWLAAHNIDADSLLGVVSLSGQMITHFTVRQERGVPGTTPVVDDLAPLHHVRGDAPPMLLITGDRDDEMLGRYEENAYMRRMMKEAGHEKTELLELEGYDHGSMPQGSWPVVRRFAKQWIEAQQEETK